MESVQVSLLKKKTLYLWRQIKTLSLIKLEVLSGSKMHLECECNYLIIFIKILVLVIAEMCLIQLLLQNAG